MKESNEADMVLIVFLCLIIPAVYGIHGGIQEAREQRRVSIREH